MISEEKVVGGNSAIFRSKSQVVPYDKFSKNRWNHVKCEKNSFSGSPPPIIIFWNDYLGGKDSWEKFL